MSKHEHHTHKPKNKQKSAIRRMLGASFRRISGPRTVFKSGRTVKAIISESINSVPSDLPAGQWRATAKTMAASLILKEIDIFGDRSAIAAECIEQKLGLWPTNHRSRIEAGKATKSFAVFERLLERLKAQRTELSSLTAEVRKAKRMTAQIDANEFISFIDMSLLEKASNEIVSSSLLFQAKVFNNAFDEASFFIDRSIRLKKK